jgi:hypothetical protein
MLRGTLTTFRRRCGKPNCRCANGDAHESPALTYTESGQTVPQGQRGRARVMLGELTDEHDAPLVERDRLSPPGRTGQPQIDTAPDAGICTSARGSSRWSGLVGPGTGPGHPTHPELIDDVDLSHYFENPTENQAARGVTATHVCVDCLASAAPISNWTGDRAPM